MLALRSIARSLPRAAPRVANYTTRAISKPCFQAPLRASAFRIPRSTVAAFSTSSARFDDIAQELSAKLANELALEQDNSAQSADSDTNVQTFLSQNDFWTLTTRDGEQDVTLTRKYDDEEITVAFSVADFNTSMYDEESDSALFDEEEDLEALAAKDGAINQSSGAGRNVKVAPEDSIAPADREGLEEDEDFESQQAFPASVSVLIQRPSKGALRVNLVADNGRWTINAVSHLTPESTGSQSAEALLRDESETLYTGPPFAQLDEEVQTLLEQYLEARGIDTGLALFVPDYIDVKEQREYQGWLERVKNFVE